MHISSNMSRHCVIQISHFSVMSFNCNIDPMFGTIFLRPIRYIMQFRDVDIHAFSMPWDVLFLIVDYGKTSCILWRFWVLHMIVHAIWHNSMDISDTTDTITYAIWQFFMKGFEPNENAQKPLRILDLGFRDPGRIFGVFLEILVRWRTSLARTWKG